MKIHDIKIKNIPLVNILFIILLRLIVYIPAMRGSFIWDDDDYVTKNPLLNSLAGLRRVWFSTDQPSQYFPLTYTIFWIQKRIWGLNPIGYHLVNLLLHSINVLLVWIFLRRLAIKGAWLAACIFAIHPVQVETVAWITELKNILSCMFYILSLNFWLSFVKNKRSRKYKYYLLSLFLYVLALFSKTTACTLPAALILLLWLLNKRITMKRIIQVVPYVLLGLAMGLVTMWWEYKVLGALKHEYDFGILELIMKRG